MAQAARARRTAGVTFAGRFEFEDIHHCYGQRETIRGVSLTAEAGEVLCLLGPSGSGKTTLLRIAAGIEAQSAGRVRLNGREIAGPDIFMPPERRGVGLMFQDFALFPHLTIRDNVRYGLTAMSRAAALPRRMPRWSVSAYHIMLIAIRMCSPAASSSAWRWHAPSRRVRPFC